MDLSIVTDRHWGDPWYFNVLRLVIVLGAVLFAVGLMRMVPIARGALARNKYAWSLTLKKRVHCFIGLLLISLQVFACFEWLDQRAMLLHYGSTLPRGSKQEADLFLFMTMQGYAFRALYFEAFTCCLLAFLVLLISASVAKPLIASEST